MKENYYKTYKSVVSLLKNDIIDTIITGTRTGTFKIPVEERDKLIRVLDASIESKSYELYHVMESAATPEKTSSTSKKNGGNSGSGKNK